MKKCKDCPTDISDRHPRTQRCTPCAEARNKAYKQAYREVHRKKAIAASSAWNKKHREHRRAYQKAWHEENREENNANMRDRYARKKDQMHAEDKARYEAGKSNDLYKGVAVKLPAGWDGPTLYFGHTTQGFHRRVQGGHIRKLEIGQHKNPLMQEFYDLGGRFEWIHMATFETVTEASNMENYFMTTVHSVDEVFNIKGVRTPN